MSVLNKLNKAVEKILPNPTPGKVYQPKLKNLVKVNNEILRLLLKSNKNDVELLKNALKDMYYVRYDEIVDRLLRYMKAGKTSKVKQMREYIKDMLKNVKKRPNLLDHKGLSTIEVRKRFGKIGQGAFGNVYAMKSVRGGKTYAVKFDTMGFANNLKNRDKLTKTSNGRLTREGSVPNTYEEEFDIHAKMYLTMPRYLRRYFLRPYQIKGFKLPRGVRAPTTGVAYGMDFFRGQRLYQYLHNLNRRGKSKEIVRTIRKIRAAIRGMWAHGFIHRDLHMNNIMVNPKTGTPKILDFGYAMEVQPYTREWKTRGTQMLRKLEPELLKWFRKASKDFEANPNTMYFPESNLKVYAKEHQKALKKYFLLEK